MRPHLPRPVEAEVVPAVLVNPVVVSVLVLAVRGLWAGRRWARSPVMTWQVLLVVMAVGWLSSDPAWWAILVLVSALLIGVGLLLPPVVAATVERSEG